jgi:uncharacterized membrane protein
MDLSGLLTRVPVQGRPRAVVKTLLYRVLMVVVTVAVAYLFTGDTAAALNIGIVTNVIKTGTYYVYERAWDRVSWGVQSTR